MGADWSTYVMKFVPNVAANSETRIGAATVRERLAASTRLIRQRPRSPFWLRLARVGAAAHDGRAAFRRKKRGAAIRELSPAPLFGDCHQFSRATKLQTLAWNLRREIWLTVPRATNLHLACRKLAMNKAAAERHRRREKR